MTKNKTSKSKKKKKTFGLFENIDNDIGPLSIRR